MTAEGWRPMDEASQHSIFTTDHITLSPNISSYFRRPSKITKPNSRNQSPRNKTRRRMTTQFPVRTRSVVDSQRNDTTSKQRSFDIPSSTRPLSWHPTFTNDFDPYQDQNQQSIQTSYESSPYTTFAYGLVTPTSYPSDIESYSDCNAIPLDQLTEQNYRHLQGYPSAVPAYQDNFNQNSIQYATYSAEPIDIMEYSNLPWTSVPYMGTYNIATAPASPNYLPFPDIGQPLELPEFFDGKDEKEELVGMGLYDSPDQVQSSSLLVSGSLPVRRKSLKLEESFEPLPEDGDNTDAEFESVEAEDDLWSQDRSSRTHIVEPTQQQQSPLESFDRAYLHHNNQPYVVQDFPSMDYPVNLGQDYPSNYGWF